MLIKSRRVDDGSLHTRGNYLSLSIRAGTRRTCRIRLWVESGLRRKRERERDAKPLSTERKFGVCQGYAGTFLPHVLLARERARFSHDCIEMRLVNNTLPHVYRGATPRKASVELTQTWQEESKWKRRGERVSLRGLFVYRAATSQTEVHRVQIGFDKTGDRLIKTRCGRRLTIRRVKTDFDLPLL